MGADDGLSSAAMHMPRYRLALLASVARMCDPFNALDQAANLRLQRPYSGSLRVR
jgi:hypothetical protein